MNENLEIERKFVTHTAPPAELLGDGVEFDARYIHLANPIANLEVRLRMEGEKAKLTMKLPSTDGGTTRPEKNFDLTDAPAFVRALLDSSSTDPFSTRKLRHPIQDGEEIITADMYLDLPEGEKWIVEREFATKADADAWEVPEWMKECGYTEVTGNKAYSNAAIAQHGWPGE